VDAQARLVTPGLIDCHAHPLFGGNRAGEFSSRAEGQSYLDIAAAGGGIQATIEPTRAASFDQHVAQAAARMRRALAHGTTTSEAKSGYDLTLAGELRLCEVAWAVDALQPVDLVPTLLGAHALPPEYAHAGDREGYVRLVAEAMIPQAAERGLARSADVYCDQGAFTLDETRRILTAARAAGLHARAHVGQFADLGGAELIAELDGLSADHLENVSEAGISALAARGVVAVMLPGACVQLRLAPPPVAALRRAGVPMAVATDMNPGTSMSESLPVAMWLATTHYGMTVTEAWLGVTRLAARALGRHDIGVLGPGALADIVIWDAGSPAEIPYHYGVNLVERVIKAGRVVAI
jgi:imidazolonepropionase